MKAATESSFDYALEDSLEIPQSYKHNIVQETTGISRPRTAEDILAANRALAIELSPSTGEPSPSRFAFAKNELLAGVDDSLSNLDDLLEDSNNSSIKKDKENKIHQASIEERKEDDDVSDIDPDKDFTVRSHRKSSFTTTTTRRPTCVHTVDDKQYFDENKDQDKTKQNEAIRKAAEALIEHEKRIKNQLNDNSNLFNNDDDDDEEQVSSYAASSASEIEEEVYSDDFDEELTSSQAQNEDKRAATIFPCTTNQSFATSSSKTTPPRLQINKHDTMSSLQFNSLSPPDNAIQEEEPRLLITSCTPRKVKNQERAIFKSIGDELRHARREVLALANRLSLSASDNESIQHIDMTELNSVLRPYPHAVAISTEWCTASSTNKITNKFDIQWLRTEFASSLECDAKANDWYDQASVSSKDLWSALDQPLKTNLENLIREAVSNQDKEDEIREEKNSSHALHNLNRDAVVSAFRNSHEFWTLTDARMTKSAEDKKKWASPIQDDSIVPTTKNAQPKEKLSSCHVDDNRPVQDEEKLRTEESSTFSALAKESSSMRTEKKLASPSSFLSDDHNPKNRNVFIASQAPLNDLTPPLAPDETRDVVELAAMALARAAELIREKTVPTKASSSLLQDKKRSGLNSSTSALHDEENELVATLARELAIRTVSQPRRHIPIRVQKKKDDLSSNHSLSSSSSSSSLSVDKRRKSFSGQNKKIEIQKAISQQEKEERQKEQDEEYIKYKNKTKKLTCEGMAWWEAAALESAGLIGSVTLRRYQRENKPAPGISEQDKRELASDFQFQSQFLDITSRFAAATTIQEDEDISEQIDSSDLIMRNAIAEILREQLTDKINVAQIRRQARAKIINSTTLTEKRPVHNSNRQSPLHHTIKSSKRPNSFFPSYF